MSNTTRQQLNHKATYINGQFNTKIEVVGQNGYFNIYDAANGYNRIGTGKTKDQTYELLSVLEQGMRIIQIRK